MRLKNFTRKITPQIIQRQKRANKALIFIHEMR
nr:MAG TPA: hypothetical protein [Caudoviricetes sp.]